jgi:hypothetical protein
MNGTPLMSATSSLIFIPNCAAGGATWLIGPDTSYCSHATSTDNIGIGTIVYASMTSGFGNVAIGSENMKDLTSGGNNTGIGFEALHLVTTGEANTGIGGPALQFVTTGSNNVAVGSSAGSAITTGSSNVCVFSTCGANAALTGSNNVVIGGGGALLTSGARNVFMGPTNNSAGYGIATGSGNVYIGGQTTLTDQSDSITLADGDGNPLIQYLTGNGYAEISYPVKIDGSYLRVAPTTINSSGVVAGDTSPADGDHVFVTNATSCTFMSAVVGSGLTHCPLHYDGSSASWKAG